jgi:hypothetical protein
MIKINILRLAVICTFSSAVANNVYAELDKLLDNFPVETWTVTASPTRSDKSLTGSITMELYKATDKEKYTLRINVPPSVDKAIKRDETGTLYDGRALFLELSKPGTITLGVEDDKAHISTGELYFKETTKLGVQVTESVAESKKRGTAHTPAEVTTVDWLPWLDTNKEKALVEFVLGYFGGNIWSYFALGSVLSEIAETNEWALTTGVPRGFHAKPSGEYKESDYGKEAFYGPDDERTWDFHTAAWKRLSDSWKSKFGTWGYQVNYTFYVIREKPDKTPLYIRVLLPISRIDSYRPIPGREHTIPYIPLIKYIEVEWLTELPGKEPVQETHVKEPDTQVPDITEKSDEVIETAIKVTGCKCLSYTSLNGLYSKIDAYNAGKEPAGDFLGNEISVYNPGDSSIAVRCSVNNTGSVKKVFHAKAVLEKSDGGAQQCGVAHNITVGKEEKKNIIVNCSPKYAPAYKLKVSLFNKLGNIATWEEPGDQTFAVYPLAMYCSTGLIYSPETTYAQGGFNVSNTTNKQLKARLKYHAKDRNGKIFPVAFGTVEQSSSGKSQFKSVETVTIGPNQYLQDALHGIPSLKLALPPTGPYTLNGIAYDCTNDCTTTKLGFCDQEYSFCVCKKDDSECINKLCNP